MNEVRLGHGVEHTAVLYGPLLDYCLDVVPNFQCLTAQSFWRAHVFALSCLGVHVHLCDVNFLQVVVIQPMELR